MKMAEVQTYESSFWPKLRTEKLSLLHIILATLVIWPVEVLGNMLYPIKWEELQSYSAKGLDWREGIKNWGQWCNQLHTQTVCCSKLKSSLWLLSSQETCFTFISGLSDTVLCLVTQSRNLRSILESSLSPFLFLHYFLCEYLISYLQPITITALETAVSSWEERERIIFLLSPIQLPSNPSLTP